MGSGFCKNSSELKDAEVDVTDKTIQQELFAPQEDHVLRVPSSGSLFKALKTASGVKDWSERIKQDADNKKLFNEYNGLLRNAGAEFGNMASGFTKDDCLVIVDMQNDFVPQDPKDNPNGGKFGVPEGAVAAATIIDMIKKAADAKALIVATRDYHPIDHCSFSDNGGHFPPHCIQGSKGSKLFQPINEVLGEVKGSGAEVSVVFKGFHPGTDSFGCLKYGPKYFTERGLGNSEGPTTECQLCHGCSLLDWTGCFALKCSNIDEDLNAPPDVLAVYEKESLAQKLQKRGVRRIFACGLALDFCVLDTALNAATAQLVPAGVNLVVDAARAAYIPGVGTFGSGFLSDPKEIVEKTKTAGVKLVNFA